MFVADSFYGYIAGDTRIPEEFANASIDACQIQEHILMSEIEYVKGEYSIAKNVAERIVLWSDFDKNGSDIILAGEGLRRILDTFRLYVHWDVLWRGVQTCWKREKVCASILMIVIKRLAAWPWSCTKSLQNQALAFLNVCGIAALDSKKLKDAGLCTIEAMAYSPKKDLLLMKGLSEAKVERSLKKI
ncbi:hypothetical protein L7F22_006947 [Adiantum nelumboides]|nr:hypothetical protein [Adiantum nelumboides]